MKSLTLFVIVAAVFLTSCTEKERGPLVKSNKAPGILSNISVDNFSGGVKITYTLPDDPDVLYVMAKFSNSKDNNKTRVVKSSAFTDVILLYGFTGTNERTVSLYAVNRSGVQSKPVEVKIKPLTAPIHYMFESLKVEKGFGGVNIHFYNKAQNEYVLYTLIKDSIGNWKVYDRLYTSAIERNYSIHGLPSEPTDLGFFIMDKWQNHSDTLFKTITPLYEEKIDKSSWKLYPLDNDSYEQLHANMPPENIWDGEASNPFFLDPNIPGLELPNWLTIDLGKPIILSRIKYHQYTPSNYENWFYTRGQVKKFEVWGSNDPSLDGSWDNWTLLVTAESVKPSGLPPGEVSSEDIALALAGEDFAIPYTGIAYRYIRLKTVKTWGNRIGGDWGEITLFGQPK